MQLKKLFKFIEFNHVYRENNKRADELSNIALQGIHLLNEPLKLCDIGSSYRVLMSECATKDSDFENDFEEEKLEDIQMKRPSKRLAKLMATKIDSFFPIIINKNKKITTVSPIKLSNIM
jgi:hypothetical protein